MCSLEYNFAHNSENANTYEKKIGPGMHLPGHAFEGHTNVVIRRCPICLCPSSECRETILCSIRLSLGRLRKLQELISEPTMPTLCYSCVIYIGVKGAYT